LLLRIERALDRSVPERLSLLDRLAGARLPSSAGRSVASEASETLSFKSELIVSTDTIVDSRLPVDGNWRHDGMREVALSFSNGRSDTVSSLT
jgi:hypothetical protein